MRRSQAPSHPGGILKRLYLEPLSLTTVDLANAIGVSRKTVSKLINERAGITAEMAVRLAIAFKSAPELWMNLQQNYDLWHAKRTAKRLKSIKRLAA